MQVRHGDTIWGVRIAPPPAREDWVSYTLGATLGLPGGYGTVHRLLPKKRPPLVAKIYHNKQALSELKTDPLYAMRLLALITHRASISQQLPFCAFPRRALFRTRAEPAVSNVRELIGFTMEERVDYQQFKHLIYGGSPLLTTERAVALIQVLGERLHAIHTHPWSFRIGDISPNNILINTTLTDAVFIDLDTVSCHIPSMQPMPAPTVHTPGFESPLSFRPNFQVSVEHDNFALATLIFMLLMSSCQYPNRHPFLSFQPGPLGQYIKHRIFTYSLKHRAEHLPSTAPVQVYDAWHPTLRNAFEQSFFATPLTGKEWAQLIRAFRRSLRGT